MYANAGAIIPKAETREMTDTIDFFMGGKRLQNTEVAYGGVKVKAMQMYFLNTDCIQG